MASDRSSRAQHPVVRRQQGLAILFSLVCKVSGQELGLRPDVRMGGSLSLSSGHSLVSHAMYRGLVLFAETVNATGAFVWRGGRPTVSLHIKDDEGSSDKVQSIYEELTARTEVDLLLGPVSSSLSLRAAEISDRAARLLMLLNGAVSEIFHKGYRHVFTMSPEAKNYLSEALKMASAQGSRSVAVVSFNSSFEMEACAGASIFARGLGMTVVKEVILEPEAMMPQLRYIKSLGPDVLLGCGSLHEAVQITMAARTLSFSPPGMILTNAATQAFVEAVGAPNSHYLLSPSAWAETGKQPCPLFGSSHGFADAYRQRWGEEPMYHSAVAAAAGVALMSALEQAQTLDVEAMRSALLGLNVQTLIGTVAFSENGTSTAAAMRAIQVQPLGQDASSIGRWTQSTFVPVSDGGILWPMPSWEEKEVRVYPCELGQEMREQQDPSNWTVISVTCEPCSTGRYRGPLSVVCVDCDPGQYGTEEGMSQCETCPPGADCPGGWRPGDPDALPGFYKLPARHELFIMPCSPQDRCLAKNQCAGENTGILCEQCSSNFARVHHSGRGAECEACGSAGSSYFRISLMVILYALYIWTIVSFTLSASMSIRAVHSVIMKICVNYIQFAGIAFEAADFKTMFQSICGVRLHWLLPVLRLPEIIQYPLPTDSSLECLLKQQLKLPVYQALVVVGLILMPVAFLLKTVLAMIRKDLFLGSVGPRCKSLLEWLRSWPDRRPDLATIDEETSNGGFGDRTPAVSPSARTFRGDGGFTPTSCFTPGNTSPWRVMFGEEFALSPSPHRLRRQTQVLMSSIAVRFMNSSIVMSFILHPLVVRLLLVSFECVDLDVLRQRYDLDVACKSAEHLPWLVLSFVGLLVYGLGTPAFLFILLFRVRKRLLHTDVRKRFGFLYNGFELRYYYFEAVYMIRKVVLLLCFITPTMYVRMILMLFSSWGFILLHLRTEPFDNRGFHCLDRLEALSLWALTSTVASRLVYDIRQEISGQFFEDILKHWTIDILLVLIPLLVHAAFVFFAVWSLFRNIVLKHLSLKAEIWPERMTRFQRFLLSLDREQNKATFDFDERGLCLDTSQLSRKERGYILTSLADTLHRYIDAGERLHPADVAVAVHEALLRCRRMRRKRAIRLEQLSRRFGPDSGCMGTLLRWQGEISLSVHGPNTTWESERSCLAQLRRCLEACGMACGSEAAAESCKPPCSPVCLGEQALHYDMELSQEFTAAELYDSLMPIWQDITEGRGPCGERPVKRSAPLVRSISALMNERGTRRVTLRTELSDACTSEEPGEDDPEVDLQAAAGQQALSADRGSFGIENLLGCDAGKETISTDEKCVEQLDSFLSKAAKDCRVPIPTLVEKQEKLISENLQLRGENEALRRSRPGTPTRTMRAVLAEVSLSRCTSPSRARPAQPAACDPDSAPISPVHSPQAQSGERACCSFQPIVPQASPVGSPSGARSPVQETRRQQMLLPPGAVCPRGPSTAAALHPVRSPMSEVSPGRSSLGPASPWSSAMRPVTGSDWVPTAASGVGQGLFEFIGAARPTTPSAWPQVDLARD